MAAYKPPKARPTQLVCIGDRIVKGPDWDTKHNKDVTGEGTVSKVDSNNRSVYVNWDCAGDLGQFYYMGFGKFEVQRATEAIASVEVSTEQTRQLIQHQLEQGAAFTASKYSDVAITCGDVTLPVHKFMLAAHSTVFEAMFRYEMEEGKSNEIEVKDMEPEVFKAMVKFIYTANFDPGTLPLLTVDLFCAANMYNVKVLKSVMEDIILKTMGNDTTNIDDVLKLLVIADQHCSKRINMKAMELIGKNKDQVAQSVVWEKMKNRRAPLCFEVLEKFAGFQRKKS